MISIPSHDVLDAIVSQVPDSKGHVQLIEAFARRGMDGVKFMQARGDIVEKLGVYDANHRLVASNYREWLKSELADVGDDAGEVLKKHEKAGYLISERQGTLLYFSLPYGDEPGQFYQFELELAQEVIARNLFGYHWSTPTSFDDFESCRGSAIDNPVVVRSPCYRFMRVHDISGFVAEKNALFKADLETQGRVVVDVTRDRTGEKMSMTLAELQPETYAKSRNCNEYRILEDWAQSSAGRSGAKIHEHWFFHVWDYTRDGERNLGAIPGWTTTKKLAEVEAKPRNITDYAIFDKLTRLSERVGVPFGWYFFMLHGNRVHDWAGKRIMHAVENGTLVLPDHDYMVLRRWYDQPYGF